MSNEFCPIQDVLKLVGSKWKLPILFNLQKKPIRYGALHRILKPITQQMLSKELKELEKFGFINRKVYEIIPPKVEYSLTKFGMTLIPITLSIENFGIKNKKQIIKLLNKT